MKIDRAIKIASKELKGREIKSSLLDKTTVDNFSPVDGSYTSS